MDLSDGEIFTEVGSILKGQPTLKEIRQILADFKKQKLTPDQEAAFLGYGEKRGAGIKKRLSGEFKKERTKRRSMVPKPVSKIQPVLKPLSIPVVIQPIIQAPEPVMPALEPDVIEEQEGPVEFVDLEPEIIDMTERKPETKKHAWII